MNVCPFDRGGGRIWRQTFSGDVLMHLSLSGMCNPKNYSDSPATSKSTVEELHRPIPSLFRALTEGDAPINMMVVSFPVAEEFTHHENLVSFLESLNSQPQNVSVPGNSIHTSIDPHGKLVLVSFLQRISIKIYFFSGREKNAEPS